MKAWYILWIMKHISWQKLLFTGIALALTVTTANAQLFNFSGSSGSASDNPNEGAAVSGTVNVDTGAGTVTFTIDNDGAGFITGFAFLNSPSKSDRPNGDELSWLSSTNNLNGGRSWSDQTVDNYWQNDEPYYGAAAGNPKPFNAIQNGEMGAEFVFTVNGGNLLDLVDMWAANSPVPTWSSNNPTSDMLFRVQGTSGPAGSDKIAVNIGVPGVAVPEPSTYGIIGAAALGLLIVSRRFRKNK